MARLYEAPRRILVVDGVVMSAGLAACAAVTQGVGEGCVDAGPRPFGGKTKTLRSTAGGYGEDV